MSYDDLLELIKFVNDSKAVEQRVKELKAREEAILANIQLTEDVADIETAKKLAVEALTEARATVEAAKTEAQNIIAAAQREYNKKFAELQVAQTKAEEAVTATKQMEQRIEQKEIEWAAEEKRQAKLAEALAAQQRELNAKQADVDARLDKLKSVMG
jgi:uncharacterized coiled-coil protein SlyX